jgi:hypothetical protein
MKKLLFLSLMLLVAIILNALPDLRFEVESGLAIPGYNDVRIPNVDPNTMFSLKNDLNLSPTLHGRLNIHYRITPRNQISLLVTPLTLKADGKFDRNIRYQGTTFFAGEPIEASYRFDSYRLQYRYILAKEFFHIRSIGASLKLRDAEIALETTGGKKATKTNTGFVPLLSLDAGYRINPKLDLVLQAEGLASPYGRAEDVFVGGTYQLKDKLGIKAGYRFLEGGSDIEEVYTFSAVHYLVLGVQVKL